MKTKNSILFILICATIFSCGSSSANVRREKRNVEVFTKISSASGINVNFVQGNSHTLEIETDAENLKKLEVSVERGTLTLKCKDGERFKRNSMVTVYVSAKKLEAIAMSGGSDFFSKKLDGNGQFSIAASGGADVDIDDLNMDECRIALSGGADCEIKQLKAKILDLAASGGSDASIHLKESNTVSVATSGGADVILTGKTKSLSASSSGGSDLDLSGMTYETISSNKSGGGSIKK